MPAITLPDWYLQSQMPDKGRALTSALTEGSVHLQDNNLNEVSKTVRQNGGAMKTSDVPVSRPPPEHPADMACSEKVRRLTDIFLYPIKSCGAFRKREPRLCLLAPVIHLDSGKLELSFPGTESCYIGLDTYETDELNNTSICTNKICNDKVNTVDCGEAVAQWLCETFERPELRLLRQLHDDSRHSKRKDVAAGDTEFIDGYNSKDFSGGYSGMSIIGQALLLSWCTQGIPVWHYEVTWTVVGQRGAVPADF
ncbi:hypothetical protein C0Q70_02806 [Pomacea canaliculata]|uniref:Molybdenum cofactor sulfurase middle domain-containing protein n=1 Tax=Pomacea canaliculata TaxID=400727 RepID=A0A2T7PR38_POMCA|nr:hypothetical protein C0Q70_02806 [Pomacea canaliculata]